MRAPGGGRGSGLVGGSPPPRNVKLQLHLYSNCIFRTKSAPILTETLIDKKVKIGELVELSIAGNTYVGTFT